MCVHVCVYMYVCVSLFFGHGQGVFSRNSLRVCVCVMCVHVCACLCLSLLGRGRGACSCNSWTPWLPWMPCAWYTPQTARVLVFSYQSSLSRRLLRHLTRDCLVIFLKILREITRIMMRTLGHEALHSAGCGSHARQPACASHGCA